MNKNQNNFSFNNTMLNYYDLMNLIKNEPVSEVLKLFSEYSINGNEIIDNVTILMIAVIYNKKKIVEYLILQGADVNAKGRNGITSLKIARYFMGRFSTIFA